MQDELNTNVCATLLFMYTYKIEHDAAPTQHREYNATPHVHHQCGERPLYTSLWEDWASN